MTKEQIINTIYETFVVGKAPQCKKIKGACEYGDPDNSVGCAVACLMDYDTRIKLHDFEVNYDTQSRDIDDEELGTGVVVAMEAGLIPLEWLDHQDLLVELQSWHDHGFGSLSEEYRVDRLHEIAIEYGVKVSW